MVWLARIHHPNTLEVSNQYSAEKRRKYHSIISEAAVESMERAANKTVASCRKQETPQDLFPLWTSNRELGAAPKSKHYYYFTEPDQTPKNSSSPESKIRVSFHSKIVKAWGVLPQHNIWASKRSLAPWLTSSKPEDSSNHLCLCDLQKYHQSPTDPSFPTMCVKAEIMPTCGRGCHNPSFYLENVNLSLI